MKLSSKFSDSSEITNRRHNKYIINEFSASFDSQKIVCPWHKSVILKIFYSIKNYKRFFFYKIH